MSQRETEPVRTSPQAAPDLEAVEGYLRQARDGVLGEWPTMRILELYGFKCARSEIADSAEAAAKAAQVIGFPVAIKAQVPGVTHKHRSGLVRLGLSSDRELIQAYEDIAMRSRELRPTPDRPIVLVQEMIRGEAEIFLGMSVDPLFGPVVAFGLGGVWVETLRDVSLRLADLSAGEARRMIHELRGFQVLKNAGIDLDRLAGTILQFARLAADLAPQVREIDVNPLILAGDEAIAVDGLMVLRGLRR
ncbi:MAG: acetate--CoA ligase family protein [Candidatus Tectomicrobia bacterium]|uniref:Acetate--CoA ligase family protein n=1 Tax=Tectimicrobiota bacterium TaxID=2528274 RepID=A0A932M0N6_UNCTE|nr:acetate--CoA ligase family protein [Candidatus Tectomicrobia bacterium]